MMDAARASGVNGVPSVIIDGKWALNGVQSTECYLQVSKDICLSRVSPNNRPPCVLVDFAENCSGTVNT